MTTKVTSLADGILKEQERCRELLAEYRKIGPAGSFGALMISAALGRTEQAVMNGDIVAMLRCYDELRGFE